MNLKSTTSSITDFFSSKPKFKYYLPQILTLLGIIFIFGYFSYNAQVNMDNRGIDFGLRFLGEEASFDIQFSLIEYSGASTYARAYLVGVLNTILVAVIGIFFATILGVVIGISRLSPNYLISKGINDKYIKETISKIKDENEDQDFFSAIKICKKKRIGPSRYQANRPLFYKKDISILARSGFDFETSKKVLALEKEDYLKIINLL